jgi:hypothetical protein
MVVLWSSENEPPVSTVLLDDSYMIIEGRAGYLVWGFEEGKILCRPCSHA